jgi:hypothetical protein
MPFVKEKHLEYNFLKKEDFVYSEEKIDYYTIPIEYSNRPDLISYILYKDTSYQTLLTFINNITDTPEGYYQGRTIKYLKKEYL